MIVKNIFFIILLPLFCFSSEKVGLTNYPRLETILKQVKADDGYSSAQLACINQYIPIAEQQAPTIDTVSYTNIEQKKNIVLGLYSFYAPVIQAEKKSSIIETNKAFTMAFPYSTSFNFSSDSKINDVCDKLENALWWDYYVNRIPFMQTILKFMNQIHNVYNTSNKMNADLL